jgi:uncharacterized protein (TIGR00255 family)
MLLSMTGFGRTEVTYKQRTIIVEIKSLNSKFLDLKLKMPQRYREKELAIRQIISPIAQRGKVDMMIDVVNMGSEDEFSFNRNLFKAYYKEIASVSEELGIKNGDFLQTIIRMPNVVVPNEGSLDDAEWEVLAGVIEESIERLNEYRRMEGQVIEDDFSFRVKLIKDLLDQITPFVDDRRQKMQERLRQNFDEHIAQNSMDENRFEQELLYYLEKMDITEEQVRLTQHCKFFLEVLNNKEDVKGRKLNFISQEMGREINTIGSKANHSEIQHIVVQMKDELEKIKEQLANTL